MNEETTKSVDEIISEKLIDFATSEVEVVSVIENDTNKAQVRINLSPKLEDQHKGSLSTRANALAVQVINVLSLTNVEIEPIEKVSDGVYILPLHADFVAS